MRYADFTQRLAGEGAAAWDLHVEAVNQKRAGKDVIVLSIGDPEFHSPPAIVESAVAGLRSGDTHYADVLGLPRARKAVAAQHARLTRQPVGPENVAIVAGAQGGLFAAAMCILGPGDEVIVLEPMYVTYEATVQAGGAHLVRVPLAAETGFRLDLAALEQAITPRTRAIFFATPNNPTGAVLNRVELEGIAALARRHDLWVVSDEVYSTIIFEGEHVSICSLPGMAERTVTINSLSKSHAMTGWRAGWIVGPSELIHHVGNLGLTNLYGLPPFIQNALALALESHVPEVAEMREAYRRRRDLALAALGHLPGIICRQPAAGMFMLADVRGTGLTARDYAWRLFRETGVAVLDATAFGKAAAGHLRISFAIDEASLAEACRRIADFTRSLGKAA
ncbi:L-aspartate aminotransferase [Dongia mobilis]|uniref:Aminotransferase n=2 Tax=Dongia mobilis TaxID=578943 RepID=A0A4R6WLV3_9PROT|nr:L-aspartate aminotransferase [Dongia mobilis]